MKVLIVDDNGLMRGVIRTFLEQAGHQVLGEAGEGVAAVKAFAELRPDLVLLDLILPGETGLDVLKEIRAMDPAAKVVVVTVVEQEGMDREILRQGALAILRKPFSSEDFNEVMKSLG